MPKQQFLQRINRHIANPMALPRLIWKNLAYPFSQKAAEKRYDASLGIDTGGYLEPAEFGVSGGQAYAPTPPAVAKFLLEQLAPRTTGYTLVDIGSGKGRVLLIAAQFQFRQIIGWEYSEILNQVAQKNVEKFQAQHPGATSISIVQGDATKLPFPGGPLVLFLFNTFQLDLARAFCASLKASYVANPRKIICVYYNPVCPEEFDGMGIFKSRTVVKCPPDKADMFANLNFPAIVYET